MLKALVAFPNPKSTKCYLSLSTFLCVTCCIVSNVCFNISSKSTVIYFLSSLTSSLSVSMIVSNVSPYSKLNSSACLEAFHKDPQIESAASFDPNLPPSLWSILPVLIFLSRPTNSVVNSGQSSGNNIRPAYKAFLKKKYGSQTCSELTLSTDITS